MSCKSGQEWIFATFGREAPRCFGGVGGALVPIRDKERRGRCEEYGGGNRKSRRTKRHSRAIFHWVRERPDRPLDKICCRLAEQGHRVSRSAIWRLRQDEEFGWNGKREHADKRERDDERATVKELFDSSLRLANVESKPIRT